jgi:hypothetical protein
MGAVHSGDWASTVRLGIVEWLIVLKPQSIPPFPLPTDQNGDENPYYPKDIKSEALVKSTKREIHKTSLYFKQLCTVNPQIFAAIKFSVLEKSQP